MKMRLMRRAYLLSAILALIAAPAFAQLKPSGTLTPGHAIRIDTAGGIVSDAGGAAGSTIYGAKYLTELGITNTGSPFCINDALTSVAYHALCFGANSASAGVISFIAYGSATNYNLGFDINGTTILTLASTGLTIASGGVVTVGSSAGVTCSGAPTSSFATSGGIVTHC